MRQLDYSERFLGVMRAGRWLVQDALMMKRNHCTDSSEHIEAGLAWLISAQDATSDGGVSKGFALHRGWLPSYVETTGYIIPTMFDSYRYFGRVEYYDRALRMADWELSQQLQNGAFPGCQAETHGKPIVFDTGMVLFGLIRAFEETRNEDYKSAAKRAGNWLLKVQSSSGAWEACTLTERPRAYHTRVAWALLELHKLCGDERYLLAATRHLDWAVEQQQGNGWFRNNTFGQEKRALTHAIAYATRGLLESGMILREDEYTRVAWKTADRLCALQNRDGSLAGRFGSRWQPDSHFTCLSADAQVAIIWIRLFKLTGQDKYLHAANRAVAFLKERQVLSSTLKDICGGISASHPIYRGYIKFFYPNWTVKFFIDMLLLEEDSRKRRSSLNGK